MKLRRTIFFATLLVLSSSLVSAQNAQSVYTDLSSSKCRTIEVDRESGSSVQSCPGIAGYRLLVLDDDSRQSVTVVDPTRKKHELNLWDVITGAFSSVGEKAEWRVVKKGRRAVPFALIIRVVANENVENPTDKRSYLSVTKISSDSICVTHKINPGPNANEAARKAADEAAITPCLKEITP